MASGARDWEGQFVVVGQRFHGFILGSRVFFLVLGRFWRRCFATLLYLAAKPTHVGVDVERLACPLHCFMACGRQMRGYGLLPGIFLFYCCSGAVAPFQGMWSPRALIFSGVLIVWMPVLPNLTWSKSCFIGARISFVRAITAFSRVSLVYLLC
jgi:hypothetical protein